MPTSIAAFEISRERGFLPLQDPLPRLPKTFDAWENVAQRLPKLFVSDQLRRTIAELPPFPIEAIHDSGERERAMLLLSYLGHAYVWGGARAETILPARLAVPWQRIAQSLGRPPVLSYSSYALHNFFRFDPSREIECGNLGLVQNFLGGIDEEWFILIHVEIERKAAPALAALHASLDAVEARDAEQLEMLLSQVESSMNSMHATLRRMPEHCEPFVYYHRVRPYIHGWKDHPDIPDGVIYEGVEAYGGRPQQFRGETGAQSAIVPALDAMLGVGAQARRAQFLSAGDARLHAAGTSRLHRVAGSPHSGAAVCTARRPAIADSGVQCVRGSSGGFSFTAPRIRRGLHIPSGSD